VQMQLDGVFEGSREVELAAHQDEGSSPRIYALKERFWCAWCQLRCWLGLIEDGDFKTRAEISEEKRLEKDRPAEDGGAPIVMDPPAADPDPDRPNVFKRAFARVFTGIKGVGAVFKKFGSWFVGLFARKPPAPHISPVSDVKDGKEAGDANHEPVQTGEQAAQPPVVGGHEPNQNSQEEDGATLG